MDAKQGMQVDRSRRWAGQYTGITVEAGMLERYKISYEMRSRKIKDFVPRMEKEGESQRAIIVEGPGFQDKTSRRDTGKYSQEVSTNRSQTLKHENTFVDSRLPKARGSPDTLLKPQIDDNTLTFRTGQVILKDLQRKTHPWLNENLSREVGLDPVWCARSECLVLTLLTTKYHQTQSHLALNVERMVGMPKVCPQLPYLWLLFGNPFPLEQPATPDIPLFKNSAAFPRDKHQQQQPRTLDPATRLNEVEWRKGAGLVFPTEFTHPSASATPTDLFKVFRPKNGLLK